MLVTTYWTTRRVTTQKTATQISRQISVKSFPSRGKTSNMSPFLKAATYMVGYLMFRSPLKGLFFIQQNNYLEVCYENNYMSRIERSCGPNMGP